MSVYLDECQAGCDSSDIGFPHVLLCMAVVVQTKGWLYGFHFDEPNSSDEYAGALLDFIQRKGGNVANCVRLYGCCNHAVRNKFRNAPAGNAHAAWRAEMQQIAAALRYHGRVSGFDTDIIDPHQGTYMEFHREQGKNRCRIYYKRHEKVAHNANIIQPPFPPDPRRGDVNTWKPTHSQGAGAGDWTHTNKLTTSADLAQGATKWHELNYALRLTTFRVT